jgi:hypothetical protein
MLEAADSAPALFHHVAIVGGGPRCVYALERLVAYLSLRRPSRGRVTISVFEKSGEFGAGEVHSYTQPSTSYLNRVVGQVGFAADETVIDRGQHLLPAELRPTFSEWCREQYARTGDRQFALGPDDVPLRRLHGMALRDMFERYSELLRSLPGVELRTYPEEVVDVVPRATAPGAYDIVLASGACAGPAHHVLFVTGHGAIRPRAGSLEDRLSQHVAGRYVRHAYPLERKVHQGIASAGSSVGVVGLGLTAIDVFLHLTEGRGGRFVADASLPGGLRYVPSGREPAAIVAMSRSGLVYACRPRNQKPEDGSGTHRGVFFNLQGVARLRHSYGKRMQLDDGSERLQLDFTQHVLPLVLLEMAYVYYRTLLGTALAEQTREAVWPAYERFLAGEPVAAPDQLLEPLHALFDRCAEASDEARRFCWQTVLEPMPRESAKDGPDWQRRCIACLETDLANAAQGNLDNPVKAACDAVWRDLRPVLAAAIDEGGITATSHREFVAKYLRYYNRLSNGASLEPMRKVLALMVFGLLDASVGPEPIISLQSSRQPFAVAGARTGVQRQLDWIVDAKVHPFDAALSECSLYPQLLKRGLVQKWRNPASSADAEDYFPGGIHLSPSGHPWIAGRAVNTSLTFMGAPVDRIRFFQLVAARPNASSPVLREADSWARELVSAIEGSYETWRQQGEAASHEVAQSGARHAGERHHGGGRCAS